MILHHKNNPNFRLKLIEKSDIEDLREWKNENRQYFFYKEIITEEQQANWFEKHKTNKQDFMFVVQENNATEFINIGCMGYRLENDNIDIYNIMRGRLVENSKNSMADAFNMMNVYISDTYKLPVTCLVLNENPARKWYEKNSLELIKQNDDHVVYKLNACTLPKIDIQKVE